MDSSVEQAPGPSGGAGWGVLRALFASYAELPRRVHILCFGAFVSRAGGMLIPFLALYLTESRGFSPSVAARIMGAFGAGGILAGIAGGFLADKIGRQPVMIGALVGAAGTILVIPGLTEEWSVLAAVVAFSLCSESYRPAGSAMLGDLTSVELRPRAYALFYVAINLGFTVGAALGGWLIVATSYDTLFYVEATAQLLFAGLIFLALPETLPPRAPKAAPQLSLAQAIALIVRDRVFMGFTLANGLIGMMFNQSFSTLPLYLEQLGIGPDVYGRVMAVNGVLIVLGQLPLADRLGRFDRGRGLILGSVFLTLGFGLKAFVVEPMGFVAAVVLWTFGEMCLASLSQPLVNDLAPAALRGRYLGVFAMSFSLSMCVGPPLGGWVLEAHGGPTLWLGTAGVGAAATLLFWALRAQLARRAA